MARIVSATAQQAVNAPQTNQVFLVIVEITHTDLVTPLRFVNNNVDITSNGNVYTACAFNFTPPADEDGTIKNTQIIIDNVDRSITQVIRALVGPPSLSISIILADNPNDIEVGPWEFILRNVTYNISTIGGDLIYLNYLLDYFSPIVYNANNFPGLYA